MPAPTTTPEAVTPAADEPKDLDAFLGETKTPAWHRWLRLGGIALAVVLALLGLWYWLSPAKTGGYATAPVEQGKLMTTVSATGRLAPTNQVTVGSQLSGLVTTVLVDVNDRVVAGQALAEIDPSQLDDQIRQAEATLGANAAQVQQARATLAQSQAQLARLEDVYRLSGGKVPSGTELQSGRADVQRAVAALAVAQANVKAQQAVLSQAKVQRARAIIRSPVSGVVLARQIDPGQTVAASFNTPTLFVIAEDLAKMKLEVSIDEADVGAVKVGQKASFGVDAFVGERFPARITRVDIGSNLTVSSASSSSSSSSTTTSTTSGQVVSYAADLSVDNTDLRLRPGMTATADIVTSDRDNVLMVPNAALRFTPSVGSGKASGVAGALKFGPPRLSGGSAQRTATVRHGAQQTVYVQNADGALQAVQITTGDSNGTKTEVIGGGLKPGMQVVTGELASTAASPRKTPTPPAG
ncbi:efflux RND transporter periplasmic adaptor subunit [Novosphingobium sp.]|uniref:efflux RND transporter periplasmic adaptor subunit n=1 Tax=Novosphingobium sp. TaxID=1874826 RepID=UPI0038B9D6E8